MDETDARGTMDGRGRNLVAEEERREAEADTKRRGGRPFYSRKCRLNEGSVSEAGRLKCQSAASQSQRGGISGQKMDQKLELG